MAVNATFWWLPDDEAEFLSFVENEGRVIALPLELSAPVTEDLAYSPKQLIGRDQSARMFLVLRSHLQQLEYVPYDKDGVTLFGIGAINSPVVSYKRSVLRESKTLSQASVSFYSDRLSADQKSLVAKQTEFTAWATSIVSSVRKKTPQWHKYKSYRISNRVADALEQGLELVL
jgi:hypothetical protein